MTGLAVDLSSFTLTFDSSPIKGEGDSVGWFVLLCAPPFTSGLRIKSAMTVPTAPPTLWILDQVQNDGAGRAVTRCSLPCGFWIKPRMTGPGWCGFAGLGRCGTSFSPSAPSVRHWDRLWSSTIKGEVDGGWLVVLYAPPFTSGLRVKSVMTVPAAPYPVDSGSSPE